MANIHSSRGSVYATGPNAENKRLCKWDSYLTSDTQNPQGSLQKAAVVHFCSKESIVCVLDMKAAAHSTLNSHDTRTRPYPSKSQHRAGKGSWSLLQAEKLAPGN